MNPRRVHTLMKANFPAVDLAAHTWVNILESDGSVRRHVLAGLLDQFIDAEEVPVEVSRKLGDALPAGEVVTYVESHIGQGQIRITDRAFRGYVLVAASGVATGG